MRLWLSALLLLALSGAARAQANPEQLSFGAVRLDPTQIATTPGSAGAGLYLVQFYQSPTQAQRDALTAAGLRVLQYYPSNAYLVWGTPMALERSAESPQVRWSGELRPAWKLSPELFDRHGRIEQLQALVYDDGRIDELLAHLATLGASRIGNAKAQPDGALRALTFAVDASQLPMLQSLPQVLWLEYASTHAVLDDEAASQIVAGNYSAQGTLSGPGYLPFLSVLGLSGAGVRFAVTDTGIDYAHPELGPRIVAGQDYPGCTSAAGQPGDDQTTGGHGTHVAGILAGAGVLPGALDANGYHYGIGVAPGVELVALNPICGSGSGSWPPDGGWQALSRRALELGAIGSNNSWTSGELLGLGYGASARSHDFIVRDGNFDTPGSEPFVLVFSAGNSGPQAGSITPPKEAKNLIVVGNAQSTRPVPQIDAIAASSSRGPALDGRLLPTVLAPGSNIASTRRSGGANYCADPIAASGVNQNYAWCSGTSMAAPHASGLVVLLTQAWRQSHAGATPSPALLKALLVNGAVDVAGAPPVPNNSEGWGRIDFAGSLGRGAEQVLLDQQRVLDQNGEEFVASYRIADPSRPLRVTLVWTDAPGAPGANPALVNNLDLRVDVDGDLYRGNVFSGGVSITGGSADAVNNLENVYLPARVGNTISVHVRAQALPGDGVPAQGDDTDQDFALVCSNCSSEPGFALNVPAAPAAICAGRTLERSVGVAPLFGFSAPVTLSLSGWPAPGAAGFSVNPLTGLTAVSTLMLDSSGVAAADYPLQVDASAGSQMQSAGFSVHVAVQRPLAATLQEPADGALQVARTPLLRWDMPSAAFDVEVQLASDVNFHTIVDSSSTRLGQWTPTTALAASTQYYWRVLARNGCSLPELHQDGFEDLPAAAGTPSEVRRFTTGI